MIHRNRPWAAIALAATILSTGSALAQSTEGGIVGAAVAGETIIIRNADRGFERELHIEKTGKYSFRHLQTGTYSLVRVGVDGSIETRTVDVVVGKTARVR
jgi:hypothetical protein